MLLMMALRAIEQRYFFSRIDPLRSSRDRSLRRVTMHLCLAGIIVAGCRASPSVDPVRQIGEATNVKDAIEFRSVGEPVDVAEATTDSLSLQQAIERALRHDPDLQIALARVRSALADAKQARLLPNPVLSVALDSPPVAAASRSSKPASPRICSRSCDSLAEQVLRTAGCARRAPMR
jgi:hypothetical protein